MIQSIELNDWNLYKCIFFRSRWDTAGQERFLAIAASYYRGANGIYFIYY